MFLLFGNSVQNVQNILFSFPSNLGHFNLSFHAFWNLCVFWSKQVFKCCVNFFIIWLLSSKERVRWALHLFPFQHTLAHFLIQQRKIDMGHLQNQKPPSCIPQCILYQVEPRLLFGKRMPNTFCLFVFEMFTFGNSSFVSRLLALFSPIQKTITCISQRVITLLVQRTSGEENYSFPEVFTRFGWVDDW